MDWTTLIIGAIIGAIITLPLAIFANLVTPWVKSYFEKSSLSIRDRRLYLLIKLYKIVKRMKENPTSLITWILEGLSLGLVFLALGVAGVGILLDSFLCRPPSGAPQITTIFPYFLILFSFVLVFALSNAISKRKKDVYSFDKYREKTIAKYRKLGGNPEDLDKEEAAEG